MNSKVKNPARIWDSPDPGRLYVLAAFRLISSG